MYKYINKITGKEKKQKNTPKIVTIIVAVVTAISGIIIAIFKTKK